MNWIGGFVEPRTLRSVQRLIDHPAFCRFLEKLIGAGMIAAGGAFLAMIVVIPWRSRDRVTWGAAITVVGMSVACTGVPHLFSSRYAVMPVPFLILFLAPWMDFGRWALARSLFGSALGLAILHSYYVYAP